MLHSREVVSHSIGKLLHSLDVVAHLGVLHQIYSIYRTFDLRCESVTCMYMHVYAPIYVTIAHQYVHHYSYYALLYVI